MEKPKIFLTGTTGLLGSHLLIELIKERKTVLALVRNEEKASEVLQTVLKWYGLEARELKDRIKFIEGEVNDVDLINESLEGIEIVYHCAGLISLFNEDKWEMLKVNAEGTANIVNACITQKVRQLLYVSSISTINQIADGEINETLFTKDDTQLSAYAISKRAGENEVWRGIEEGLNAVIVNPSVIIGPSKKETGTMALFYRIKYGMKYITKGLTGYVDVRDVARICIQLIEKKITGERFIVSAENLSIANFVEKIAKKLNIKTQFKLAPTWLLKLIVFINRCRNLFTGKRYLPNKLALKMIGNKSYYSNDKIIKELNYNFISIDSAIENTISKLDWKS
jgi:dihydroflavonol-4-reductase